ncbi:hypothetical protein U1Q18_011056 [Sarracenia purpurea var. burkii]
MAKQKNMSMSLCKVWSPSPPDALGLVPPWISPAPRSGAQTVVEARLSLMQQPIRKKTKSAARKNQDEPEKIGILPQPPSLSTKKIGKYPQMVSSLQPQPRIGRKLSPL